MNSDLAEYPKSKRRIFGGRMFRKICATDYLSTAKIYYLYLNTSHLDENIGGQTLTSGNKVRVSFREIPGYIFPGYSWEIGFEDCIDTENFGTLVFGPIPNIKITSLL